MSAAMPLYRALAMCIQARLNCVAQGNHDWHARHSDTARRLVREYMPSGSGWDVGTTLDLDASTGEKLVFHGEFHHMNDHGYDGWTAHTITCTASLQSGILLRISGRDRNQIKDYLHEIFDCALNSHLLYPFEPKPAPEHAA